MRAGRELSYVIDALPEVPEVLQFLVAQAGMGPREAYGTLNMGAGFALIVGRGAGAEVVRIAEERGVSRPRRRCGDACRSPREVELTPLDAGSLPGDERALELRAE